MATPTLPVSGLPLNPLYYLAAIKWLDGSHAGVIHYSGNLGYGIGTSHKCHHQGNKRYTGDPSYHGLSYLNTLGKGNETTYRLESAIRQCKSARSYFQARHLPSETRNGSRLQNPF